MASNPINIPLQFPVPDDDAQIKNLESKIEKMVSREKAQFAYKGAIKVKKSHYKPCFQGCNIPSKHEIHVGYNPLFIKEAKEHGLDELIADKDATFTAFRSLVRHELMHTGGGKYVGIPGINDDDHVERLLEPISVVLKKNNIPNCPVGSQSLYAYMTNMLEDALGNSMLGNKSDHFGEWISYKDSGLHADKQLFTPLFSAFLLLQQELFGGKRSALLMKNHHPTEPESRKKIDDVVSNFLSRTKISDFQREIISRRKKLIRKEFDKKAAMRFYVDKNNWSGIATIFAEEFSKLIDKDQLKNPEYIECTFIPLDSDEKKDPLDDPDVLMQYVYKRYLENKEEKESFTPPPYIDQYNALDQIYRRLGKNLEIRAKATTKAESNPVVYYGKTLWDVKSRLRPFVSFYNGRLAFMQRPYHEDVPDRFSIHNCNAPNVTFIIRDDSGSMQWSVKGQSEDKGTIMNPWAKKELQWGDNSRYHFALETEWGLYDYLERKGVLRYRTMKSVSFSDNTRTAKSFDDVKKQALSPTFQGTHLDMVKLDAMFKKDELVISISDGDIDNWDNWLIEPKKDRNGKVIEKGVKIKEYYISRALENQYLHFQIGNFKKDKDENVLDKPKFCKDLEEAGHPIHVYYDDGSNLGKLVLDLTKPMFEGSQSSKPGQRDAREKLTSYQRALRQSLAYKNRGL